MRQISCVGSLLALLALVGLTPAADPPAGPSDLTGKRLSMPGLLNVFVPVRVDFDKPTRTLSLLFEARSELPIKLSDFPVSLFDADGVRLTILTEWNSNLAIQGGVPRVPTDREYDQFRWAGFGVFPLLTLVQKGERFRVSFTLPDEGQWRRTRYVVVGTVDLPAP